jgi:hypothetical protein
VLWCLTAESRLAWVRQLGSRALPRDGQGKRRVGKATGAIETLYKDPGGITGEIRDGAVARPRRTGRQCIRLDDTEPAVYGLDVATRPSESDSV